MTGEGGGMEGGGGGGVLEKEKEGEATDPNYFFYIN